MIKNSVNVSLHKNSTNNDKNLTNEDYRLSLSKTSKEFKMKKSILSLAVVAMMASGAFAMGMGGGNCQKGDQNGCAMQGRGGMQQGMQGGCGGQEMRILHMLNLTDDQRHKLAILQSEMKLEMTKLQDPKTREKMQSMMSGENFDKKEFVKMQNEMHEKDDSVKSQPYGKSVQPFNQRATR